MTDFGGLSQFVDLGIALGVATLVKLVVGFLKSGYPALQGRATLWLVLGLSLALSEAASFALAPMPWGIAALKGFCTGVVAATAAVGVNKFAQAAAGKDI